MYSKMLLEKRLTHALLIEGPDKTFKDLKDQSGGGRIAHINPLTNELWQASDPPYIDVTDPKTNKVIRHYKWTQDEILKAMMGPIQRMARKFTRFGDEEGKQDIIQAGAIGVINAMGKDPKSGRWRDAGKANFPSFAQNYIWRAMGTEVGRPSGARKDKFTQCPECGRLNKMTGKQKAQFCEKCFTDLEPYEAGRQCPTCGFFTTDLGIVYCPKTQKGPGGKSIPCMVKGKTSERSTLGGSERKMGLAIKDKYFSPEVSAETPIGGEEGVATLGDVLKKEQVPFTDVLASKEIMDEIWLELEEQEEWEVITRSGPKLKRWTPLHKIVLELSYCTDEESYEVPPPSKVTTAKVQKTGKFARGKGGAPGFTPGFECRGSTEVAQIMTNLAQEGKLPSKSPTISKQRVGDLKAEAEQMVLKAAENLFPQYFERDDEDEGMLEDRMNLIRGLRILFIEQILRCDYLLLS